MTSSTSTVELQSAKRAFSSSEPAVQLLFLPSKSSSNMPPTLTTAADPTNRPSISTDYTMEERLGSGTYGVVYRATRKRDRRQLAIKCIRRSQLNNAARDLIVGEIQVLKALRHRFIVQLEDFTWDAERIYIIMEYCSGGSLSRFIRRCIPERLCRRFLQQLLAAMQYLHANRIAHFDLKPQNLLLSSRGAGAVLKVADFGFSQRMDQEERRSGLRGSPLYMAPEMLLRGEYDERVDLWSIGVIWYECLFGRAPLQSASTEELVEKIRSVRQVDVPDCQWLSRPCTELIRRLLRANPEERIGFDELFQHPYFDLEHMPSDSGSEKADALLQRAVEADRHADCQEEAFRLYTDALAYLVPMCTYEEDATKRHRLRAKIDEYLRRAEQLKSATAKKDSPDSPALLKRREEMQRLGAQVFRVFSAQNKQRIGDALRIGARAQQHDDEDDAEAALSDYETALGICIKALRSLPESEDKARLQRLVAFWLDRAEAIKPGVRLRRANVDSASSSDEFLSASRNSCPVQ